MKYVQHISKNLFCFQSLNYIFKKQRQEGKYGFSHRGFPTTEHALILSFPHIFVSIGATLISREFLQIDFFK